MKSTDLLNIPNFRVALYSSRPDRKPVVLRSSRLDALSTEKLQSLKTHYGLKTILDLRSSREVDLSPNGPAINRVFTPRVLKPSNASKLLRLENPDNKSLIQPDDRFLLSLFGGRAIFALLGKLPNFLWKVLAFFCLLTDAIFRTKLLTKFIIPRILNPMGLEGFNYFLLDNCKTEIGVALQIFRDESRFPIVVNCAQGKDRTGLIVALLQLINGTDHEEIIRHYSLSHELLKGTQLLSEIGKKYRLGEDFESSREETMKHIIEYIINQYTSVTHYLEECGLSIADQSLIRKNLQLGATGSSYESHTDGVQSQAVSIEVEQFQQGITSEKDTTNQKVILQVTRPASSFVIADVDRPNESVVDVEVDPSAIVVSETNENDRDSQKLLELANNDVDETSPLSERSRSTANLDPSSPPNEHPMVVLVENGQHQDETTTSESHT